MTPTETFFAAFQRSFADGDYATAADRFEAALLRDPNGTFRHFVAHASAPLALTLNRTGRREHVARRLNDMLPRYPHMHYLCDEPSLERVIALREENIRAGLPSALLVSQAKSGSVAVGNIFNSGFNLPSVCYSLVNLDVIDTWARDYARGGACYVTHLRPSAEKVTQLRRAGIDRLIVHVRDPRQALISLVYHASLYPEQLPEFTRRMGREPTITERARAALPEYYNAIEWISGWLDLAGDIEILFSTHEQFVADRAAFVERYLAFYGGDRAYFSLENALGQHAGTDYHFRSGRTDEWREVLEPEFAEWLSGALPGRLKVVFGWGD